MRQDAAPTQSPDPRGHIKRMRAAIAGRPLTTLASISVLTNIVRLGSSLILTRILSPDAFGAVAVIVAITAVANLLFDLGFHPFVVRSPEGADPHFLDVIWTLRLLRSLALAASIAAFSGPIAALFAKPELQGAIAFSAIGAALNGFQSMALVTAERDRRVSLIMTVPFVVLVVQTAATIALAKIESSYWSILYGMTFGSALLTIATYVMIPNAARRIAFDKRISKDLWAFARFVVPASVVTLLVSQVDKVILGRSLDIAHFGQYALAVTLAASATQLIQSYAFKSQFPIYAEAFRRHADGLREVFYPQRRKFAALLGFVLGGGVGGAEPIIRLLFDERYLGAAPMFALLCAGPVFHISTTCAESALVVLGRLRTALDAGLLRLAWISALSLPALHFFGPLGVVAVFAFVEAPVFAWLAINTHRRGLFRWREEAIPFAAAAAGAAVGIAGTFALERLVAAGVIARF